MNAPRWARPDGSLAPIGGPDLRRFHLPAGDRMTLAVEGNGAPAAVYGEGGRCTLHIVGVAQAIFIPLRGSVLVSTSRLVTSLRAGEMLVGEFDTGNQAIGYAGARWIAWFGGPGVWGRVLAATGLYQWAEAQLLPARHATNRSLRRHAIAVVRAGEGIIPESAIHAMVDRIVALQAPLREAVSRCPGRTHARRTSVFMRLQRVRKFISEHCDRELDNRTLAHMANYSPCHFLTTFNNVFGETPHDYLLRERLARGRRLLLSSDLAIKEVATVCGFRNRSTFSRWFHQRFGITATDVRHRFPRARRPAPPPDASPPRRKHPPSPVPSESTVPRPERFPLVEPRG